MLIINCLHTYLDPFDEIHLLTEFSGDRKDRKVNGLTENTKAKDRDIKISSSDLLHFQALYIKTVQQTYTMRTGGRKSYANF